MESTRDRGPDTERSCELIEMHLFDADAREEESLCGAEVSVLDLTTVQDYLECRKHNSSVPTVCNACKVPAIHFARMRHFALTDEGMTDEAEIYRWLADTLTGGRPTRACRATRTGMTGPLIQMRVFLCVCMTQVRWHSDAL